MPKFLQFATLLSLCAIGISPLIIVPELAESNGFERTNGSTIGAFITMAWFGAMWWISYEITRRQARRELEKTSIVPSIRIEGTPRAESTNTEQTTPKSSRRSGRNRMR